MLGANRGTNYKSTPDWEKAAMEFTGGLGVDHVVEVGGAGMLTRSFGAIRVGGKISMIGGLSGPATELNPGLILARRANVQGISVGSLQMFEAMNRAIAANGIKPVIVETRRTMPPGATEINRLNFLHFLIPVRGPDRRDRDPICIAFCGGTSLPWRLHARGHCSERFHSMSPLAPEPYP